MGNSVGTVKIPIVSTFDASGVQAAKQGLKDLQGAQPGGGAGEAGRRQGIVRRPVHTSLLRRRGRPNL